MCQKRCAVIPMSLLAVLLVSGAAAQGAPMKTVGDLEVDGRVDARPDLPLGPFVRLGDGAILTVNDTKALVSRDEGATWQEQPLFGPDQNLSVSTERALVRTRNGVLVLVFMNMKDYKFAWNAEKSLPEPGTRLHVWSIRSTDDGKTWTDAQMIYEGYSGDIHDMIQTSDGHLIAPVQVLLYDEGRHALFPRFSTDDGKTWQRANLLDLGGRGHHDGLIEPTLVELRDGRVWMLCRTNLERFWSAYSDNGGEKWRVLQPSDIPASSAPGQMKRLQSGRLVLAWNRPLPEGATEFPKTGGDRQWSDTPVSNHRAELSLAFSDDDGQTWSTPAVIARRPKDSLAYPYIFEHKPGELWVTTMQGNVRLVLREADFVNP